MGDQQNRHAIVALDLADQLQDLGLNRHIQGSGGLVGDQQPGSPRQRDGNHDPLSHAARELVGVGVNLALRVWHLHPLQQRNALLARSLPLQ